MHKIRNDTMLVPIIIVKLKIYKFLKCFVNIFT